MRHHPPCKLSHLVGFHLLLYLPSLLYLLGASACGDRDAPTGVIEGTRRPAAVVRSGEASDAAAAQGIDALADAPADTLADTPGDASADASAGGGPAAGMATQILFGDLHVHSGYSIDAFVFSLPFFGGEGAHPPADACDFARHCAAVDFFAITDHAEGLTPERWREIKETIRQCNALAGDPENPDLVAFVGWEWTQVGRTPETHYGHKNVIFPGTAEDEVPARPITALADDIFARAPPLWLLRGLQLSGAIGLGEYADFFRLLERMAAVPNCERGVDSRALPRDCRENASTPAELFEKLGQWGFDTLVIPHGLSWGLHAPRGARLETQLTPEQHDPDRQRLIEIYSGHGNTEQYRRWGEAATGGPDGRRCPEPTSDYLPCCWRAGEIMRGRCADLAPAECERRVEEAKRLALEADVAPHLVFPDTRPEDWLDCDQCRDCFKPTFAPRPRATTQYSVAISNFAAAGPGGDPLRFRWGFIASSDDHSARPGTGYKQVLRQYMSDAHGPRTWLHEWLLRRGVAGEPEDRQRPQPVHREPQSFGALLDVERVASFMYPGGLVAVHATGRSRTAIWSALKRREVYGTSGPRILLWFDLLNGSDGRAPMGSEVAMDSTPRFQVRAVGARVQEPGCARDSNGALSPERLERLCRGECYNPSDRRHGIAAIEVVRVRPQAFAGEGIDALIEDPWRRFACDGSPSGCVVEFDDPEYSVSARDTVYYVRALQEATPAINAANLRTTFDEQGRAVSVAPCHGGYRTPANDDCLAPIEERAWSSPIYVDYSRPRR